jgi:hypothetical protein
MLRGRRLSLVAIGIGLTVAPSLRAAVVCQSKKNAKRIALRAEKCTKKENVAVDFATVGTQAATSTDQASRLGSVEPAIGLVCAGDPSRTLVESKFMPRDAPLARGSVRERLGGGCRTLDGNQTACEKSFQNGDPFSDNLESPATACFYHKGLCLPCVDRLNNAAGCTNTCNHVAPTCADATRTMLVGGPRSDACQSLTTQPDCEKAWHVGALDVAHPAASCYWTGSACRGCGPRHLNQGDCTNTCAPTAAPTCKDATRTVFVGGTNGDTAHRCRKFNGNQSMCQTAFHKTGEGSVASCWYDLHQNRCRGCGLRFELIGLCNNTCI